MSFPYKKVLMVGATSGIGAAMTTRILERNPSAHVVAVGRRTENLLELQKTHGGPERVSTVTLDIGKLDELEGFVQDVTKSHPDIDAVFLNAGMQRGFNFASPNSFSLADFDAEMRTNFTSFVHLTYAFVPFLTLAAASRPVSLIYTTSNLAVVPLPRCPGYSASKAALHAFILCVRQQLLESRNLKVIELMPPAVQTELHDARHQPDIKNGGQMGMPLGEFTDRAWEGLVRAANHTAEGREKITAERVLVQGFPGIDENELWREESVDRVWGAMKRGFGTDGAKH